MTRISFVRWTRSANGKMIARVPGKAPGTLMAVTVVDHTERAFVQLWPSLVILFDLQNESYAHGTFLLFLITYSRRLLMHAFLFSHVYDPLSSFPLP